MNYGISSNFTGISCGYSSKIGLLLYTLMIHKNTRGLYILLMCNVLGIPDDPAPEDDSVQELRRNAEFFLQAAARLQEVFGNTLEAG